MMHKVNNCMIQAQASERAHLDLQTWMDHFETVCREQGLEVERMLGGTMSVKTSAGSDMDAICKEATRRCSAYKEAPLTREEYDKEVDRKEDLRDLAAEKAKRRAEIVEILKAASNRSSIRGDFLSALSFALARVSIEKDLI